MYKIFHNITNINKSGHPFPFLLNLRYFPLSIKIDIHQNHVAISSARVLNKQIPLIHIKQFHYDLDSTFHMEKMVNLFLQLDCKLSGTSNFFNHLLLQILKSSSCNSTKKFFFFLSFFQNDNFFFYKSKRKRRDKSRV